MKKQSILLLGLLIFTVFFSDTVVAEITSLSLGNGVMIKSPDGRWIKDSPANPQLKLTIEASKKVYFASEDIILSIKATNISKDKQTVNFNNLILRVWDEQFSKSIINSRILAASPPRIESLNKGDSLIQEVNLTSLYSFKKPTNLMVDIYYDWTSKNAITSDVLKLSIK